MGNSSNSPSVDEDDQDHDVERDHDDIELPRDDIETLPSMSGLAHAVREETCSIHLDILQLRSLNNKNFIEKRRNIRGTTCEFCSHFILFFVLYMGYGLSKIVNIDAQDYSTISITYPIQSYQSLFIDQLSGPLSVPSYDTYNLLGIQLRDQLQNGSDANAKARR